MKTCTKCKIVKELTEFHNAKAHIDGLKHHCKACVRDYGSKQKPRKRSENRNGISKLCSPGTDGKWVYIVGHRGYYKVGSTEDPIKRMENFKSEWDLHIMPWLDFDLLYIGSPHTGTAHASEQALHVALKPFHKPMAYMRTDKVHVSREHFDIDLDSLLETCEEFCTMTKM
jgi:hypothetical protein